ncbi:hypothetical protein NLJ89_g2584 [Agrocybe chaxingu]|uniref:Uncharacterized protein n=1 Tax=Agrocybe chaxingu TaxID=84603 RepID=A0A9W8K6B5_9AGAR|nr:hypothetical protein NLJ89_g2584 [Agrocybe chaxingu]
MSDSERNRLLSVLEAHGKSFLDSFAPLEANATSSKRKSRGDDSISRNRWKQEEEEWHGIGRDSEYAGSDEDDEDEEGEGSGEGSDVVDDFEHTDDEFSSTRSQSNVIIFSDIKPQKSVVIDHVAKAQMKTFMSSKTSKVSSSITAPVTKRRREEEDEKTNVQNDALLHKLVHTKLLSGSMDTKLNLNPAQRRKALAGRVLELSGEAKLGKGEKAVRAIERTKAAKRVREGLNNKQQERRKQELEEVSLSPSHSKKEMLM